MSDKNRTIPLLIKHNNKIYRVMNTTCSRDGSMYFSFPNSSKSTLSTYTNYKYKNKEFSQSIIEFKKVDSDVLNPKITFHPRHFTFHIKSSDSLLFDKDYELYNFQPPGKGFVCYFMQIVLPSNIEQLSEYKLGKHKIECVIDYLDVDKTLSIYVAIHSSELIPTNNLPFETKTEYKLTATLLVEWGLTFSYYTSYLPRSESNNLTVIVNTLYEALFITIDYKEQ